MKFCQSKSNSGVYAIYSGSGDVLYIGASKNIYRRYVSHINSFKNGKCNSLIKKYISENGHESLVMKLIMPSRSWIFEKEANAIRKFNPPLNCIGGGIIKLRELLNADKNEVPA